MSDPPVINRKESGTPCATRRLPVCFDWGVLLFGSPNITITIVITNNHLKS